MMNRHTDHETHGELSLMNDSRTVYRWLERHAANGVRPADTAVSRFLPDVMAKWPAFDDDPAAEFENMTSQSASFIEPGHAVSG